MKDYFLCQGCNNGKMTIFWCSSSTWVFSELPAPPTDSSIVAKLKAMMNFIMVVGLPFVIMADWNMEPGELQAAGWSRR